MTLRPLVLAALLHACPAPVYAAPCETPHNLPVNAPAPCAGVLIPDELADGCASALIDLPECRARLANADEQLRATVEGLREAHRQEVDALEAMLAAERTQPAVVVTETRTAWGWVVVAGVAGVVVGGVVGLTLGR